MDNLKRTMSLYTLQLPQDSDKSKSRQCLFKSVSPCADHVHPSICNNHANLFGLMYEVATYCNGNNDVWSKIVCYNRGHSTLNIPLFLSSSGKILISEIRAFALHKCNEYPNLNIEKFQDIISKCVGFNPFHDSCRIEGYLGDAATRVLCRDENNTIRVIDRIPQLHQMLFQFTTPSIVKNNADGREFYSIPNVLLVANAANDTYHFTLINKEMVLKRNDKEYNVATPLVLMAISERSYANADKTFTPIVNMNNVCFP